jgi:hypothetical protein
VERRKACASRRTRAAPCKCGAKTCAFRRSASFSFFRSFLACLAFVPRPIVMVPALHSRSYLTKVGNAVRFLGLACS